MIFEVGVYVVFCIAYSVVNYLDIKYSGLITSIGEERVVFFCYCFTCNYVVFVRRGSSSSLCLGKAE